LIVTTPTAEPVKVLVVPAAELDRLGRFQGFCPDADRYLDALLRPGVASFQPRPAMEVDPSFKQIIPYVVFRCGDRVFCYRRGTSQGEARLHRLRSLGVGGHVDEADADGRATAEAYDIALRRELDEEVELGSPGRLTRVGLINDDATPVGTVHLGVAHVYELDEPKVAPREEGLADAEFLTLDAIAGMVDEFETWSRIVLEGCLLATRGAGPAV
jgi:predicted NUDIX family phosphoesterase